jgi:hypothetical protein
MLPADMTDTATDSSSTEVPVLTAGELIRWCLLQARDLRPTARSVVRLAQGQTELLTAGLTHHRAWGFLHAQRDRVVDLPATVRTAAAERNFATSIKHLAVHADLRSVCRSLDAERLPWLVVKGPALADRYYASAELRPYNDVDVLVEPKHLRSAIAALERSGWTMLDRNWALNLDRMVGEVHLVGPRGTIVDLHWSLQNRAYRRSRLGLSTAILMASAIAVDLDGVQARTLSWCDTIVHLALHAAGDGGDRLIWLYDVAQVSARSADSWSDLVARARAWRAGPATAMVLSRAVRELDASVPAWVLRALDPNPLGRLAEAVVSRSSRVTDQTAPHSATWRWTRLRLDPISRSRPALRVRWRGRRHSFVESAENPYSLLYDDGGADGRDRFLYAVESVDG